MQKQKLQQKQKLILGPKQIQFLNLLQTSLADLERYIEEELEKNPALEEVDNNEDIENESEDTSYSYKTREFKNPELNTKELSSPSTSLSDFLTSQLVGLNLDDHMFFLTNYLINSLDDNGFLSSDFYSISSDLLTSFNLSVKESDLEKSLHLIQNLKPLGVGAKGLQDCLLIQLKNKPSNKIIRYSITILESFYTPFSNKNFEFILKNLNISSEDLRLVYKEVEKLNPLPGRGFSKESNSPVEIIIPDFIVSITNGELDLKLNYTNEKKIKFNSSYEKLLSETKNKEAEVFLKQKIDSAKWFESAIIERGNTLKKVMTAILKTQYSYFKSGDEKDLNPMKLADISKIVNMDISTISRVSNSKYIEAPFGTFLVKDLFSEAYRKDNGEEISTKEIKSQLKKIISTENKSSPFSDSKLAEMLGKDEYHIARRTVAKYRHSLKIPVAKLRRKL